MILPEDRGHQRIHCRAYGFWGWSEYTGLCPRCPVPDAPVQGACEQCGDRRLLRRLDLAGAEYWLCCDCRADWVEARRLGMP